MEYVLGIDSGGTNYRIKAAGLDGRQLGYLVGDPANLHYLTREEFVGRVNKTIDCCLAQFGGIRGDAKYLVCGTTGIDSDEDAARVRSCYESLEGFDCPMKIINDAELAHYTVTGGKGILLISGTGSIAYGANCQGKRARIGGWPLSIYGDEGSGIWVTKMALRYYARVLDHAVEDGVLTGMIAEETGIKTREDLIQASLEGGRNPAAFPALGALVNRAAAEGDMTARGILLEAAEKLFDIIRDMVHVLDLEKIGEQVVIGVWGSNILKSELVFDRFSRLVRETYPEAAIIIPEKEAIDGAVEMALSLRKRMIE